MNEKKQILFVINNMKVGGAEKALVSLLQVLDYNRYEVDLLLFKKEGVFLKHVPSTVNILPEPHNYQYFDMPFSQVVLDNIFWGRWDVIFRRVQFKWSSRYAQSPAEAEQLGWKPLSRTILPLRKHYHAAIGFLEKSPNYFIIDKVSAKRKIAFIHNDYNALQMNPELDKPYFEKFDSVLTVSAECLTVLKNVFSDFPYKFKVLQNISSSGTIKNLALEEIEENMPEKYIVSVGRLTPQKNYDLAIDAFYILHKGGVPFSWYVLGEGPDHERLLEKIKLLGLTDKIFFLGVKENPYKYVGGAQIFLMTSLYEGDGIVVREAKILGKPIILTNFNTASSHIKNNETGIIVNHDANEIANAIESLIYSEDLLYKFQNNLLSADWSNTDEIKKLYQLIEN